MNAPQGSRLRMAREAGLVKAALGEEATHTKTSLKRVKLRVETCGEKVFIDEIIGSLTINIKTAAQYLPSPRYMTSDEFTQQLPRLTFRISLSYKLRKYDHGSILHAFPNGSNFLFTFSLPIPPYSTPFDFISRFLTQKLLRYTSIEFNFIS